MKWLSHSLFAISFFVSQLIYAQNNRIDSLHRALTETSNEREKVNILNELALVETEPYNYLIEATAISKKLEYQEGLGKAYHIASRSLINQGKYDSALALNFINLEIQQKIGITKDLTDTYNMIGVIYEYKSDYENALKYYLEGLQLCEKFNYKKGISNFYNRIGIIYNYQGNYDKTLDYFTKSLALRKELGDIQGVADMYNNIGIIYRKKDDIDKAIEYYKISLSLKKELKNKAGAASSYNNIGAAYFFKADYVQALEYYHKSLEIRIKENLTVVLPSTYINIGETYAHLNKYDKALLTINKGLSLALELGSRDDIKLGYEELAQTYAIMNDYSKAYQYHVLYNNIKDSIFNKESDERMAEMQTIYEVEKKEQKIALLQKENEIQRIEAENNELIRNVFIIAFIIISFLIIAIVRSYLDDLAKNRLLREHQDEIEAQNSTLKELSYEKDQLMKIVAHDLRSPLNQIEGLVKLINFSSENLTEDQKDALSRVINSTDNSKKLISKILTTRSIKPGELKIDLEEVDLHELLQASIRDHELEAKEKNINIHFKSKVSSSTVMVDKNYTEQVFENLISNALKFSPHDKNVYISMVDNLDGLRVEFKDEGPGINEEDQKKLFGKYQTLSATPTGGETSTGLGLSIVKKYVNIMEGNVWCESEPNKGATFIIQFKKAKVLSTT